MSSPAPSRPRPDRTLSDAEWLQSQASNLRLAVPLQEAAARGDARHLAKVWRVKLKSLRKLNLVVALRWSADPTVDVITIDAMDELRHQRRSKKANAEELYSGTVEAWLERQPPHVIPSLLDQLLACGILLDDSVRLSDGVLLRLWRYIEERAGQLSGSPSRLHPAVRELLIVEMQFLRYVICSGSAPTESDVEPVITAVRQFLGLFTDDEGHPAAEVHESLAAALASVVRIRDVFAHLDLNWIDSKDRRRLEKLMETTISLFPVDCRWVSSATPHEVVDWMKRVKTLASDRMPNSTRKLLKHWDRATSEPAERTPSAPRARHGEKRSALKEKQLISHQSDASKYALLTGDWREARDHGAVRFHDSSPTIEVSIREQQLLHGAWEGRVTAGGETWETGAWSCCCWYSDAEADFCELKSQVSPLVTVYRQLLWARQEQFLLIADEVRAPGLTGISIESSLPLVPGWTAQADGRTREWQLHHGHSVVRILPIFSPPERVQSCDDRLSCASQSIDLRAESDDTSVYSAVVIDWNPERTSVPAVWGRLTVAEDGQRVPNSLASAARWRLGDKLWMVFHQPEKGDSARSALGLHTHHETVIARVKDGEYLPLVEVE